MANYAGPVKLVKKVTPGVLALRKVVDDVHTDARIAKNEGKLVGWSSSKFPCELAAAFDLNVMYPENQAAGIAANRYGELLCQAAEDLGYDNDICGYARISLAYSAGKRAARKYDKETGEFIIDPSTGKPLKDAEGKVVIDEATGKPKKIQKHRLRTSSSLTYTRSMLCRRVSRKSVLSTQFPRSVRCRSRSRTSFFAVTISVTV